MDTWWSSKKNDKFALSQLHKNIVKSYIIGKNINFFRKQFKKKTNYVVTKTLKKSLVQAIDDINKFKKKNNSILLSPASDLLRSIH